MPTLFVTPLYAGLLGLMLVGLSASVIRERLGSGITFGDPGDRSPGLLRAVRTQGNFTEYVPLALLLLTYLELMRWGTLVLHILGIALVLGRVLHAVGLHRPNDVNPFRQAGVALTFGVIAIASILAISTSFSI